MKTVELRTIMEKKWERRDELISLGASLHACGNAFHVGEVSFGCRDCFSGEASINLFVGTKCMFKCPYCYYDPDRNDDMLLSELSKEVEFTAYKLKEMDNYRPCIISYCSAGETLLYIDILERAAGRIYPLIVQKGIRPYSFLYTNGVLADERMIERLSGMGVNEIRFHLSASDFSESVLENMRLAKKLGMLITVEEPSNPLNREKLLSLLPVFEEMGLDHLDMIEMRLTAENIATLENIFPGDEYCCYKDFYYHLYDNGLVCDIMEEVLIRGYSFSVMDCNSAVERCRNNVDQDVRFSWESIEGLCKNRDPGSGFSPRLKNGRPYRG